MRAAFFFHLNTTRKPVFFKCESFLLAKRIWSQPSNHNQRIILFKHNPAPKHPHDRAYVVNNIISHLSFWLCVYTLENACSYIFQLFTQTNLKSFFFCLVYLFGFVWIIKRLMCARGVVYLHYDERSTAQNVHYTFLVRNYLCISVRGVLFVLFLLHTQWERSIQQLRCTRAPLTKWAGWE